MFLECGLWRMLALVSSDTMEKIKLFFGIPNIFDLYLRKINQLIHKFYPPALM